MIRFAHLPIFLFVLFFGGAVQAQAPNEPREVRAVIEQVNEQTQDGTARFYRFTARTELNESFEVQTIDSYPGGLYLSLREGDHVRLRIVEKEDGTQTVYFDDKVRTPILAVLFMAFALLAIAVGFFRGIFSLIGLGITICLLGFFLLPAILDGKDPILFTVLTSILILFLNIHLSHGFRIRTFFSFLGTMGGLLFVWLFSVLFTYQSSLSGLGSEESNLLLWEIKAIADPVRIFAAAVILGAVGVLDDVAVSQSEIVEELKRANPDLTRKELFFRAMRVGQHHIASTVNTLVLVYAGAALPTFLLFFSASTDVISFLNNEVVAEEIVRTLAGTSALILTVPLSTLFATIPQIDNPEKHG